MRGIEASLPPPMPGATIRDLIERRRAALWTLLAAALAVAIPAGLSYVGYSMNFAPHRLFKVVGGIALAGLVLAKPGWIPLILCLAFPFEDWLPKSPVPLLNTTNILVMGAIFGIVLMSLRGQVHPIVRTRLDLPIALLLLWMTMSWVNGAYLWPDRTWGAGDRLKAFWSSMSGFAIYYVVTHLVLDRRAAWRLVTFLLIGSALAILGPVREVLEGGWGTRTGGGMGDINRMGAFLAMASVFAFSMLGAFGGFYRIATALSGIISAFGMFMPNSRGAYAGFLVAALPQMVRTSVVSGVMLIAILGSGALWAPSFVKERITSTFQGEPALDREEAIDYQSGGRLTVWRRAWTVIEENPIFGVGYGNMKEATRLSAGLYKHVHNLYLEVGGEMGIPGLLLFLWLFFRSWRLGSQIIKRGRRAAILGRAYQGVILCTLIVNLFGQRFLDFGLSGFYFALSGAVAVEERLSRDTEVIAP